MIRIYDKEEKIFSNLGLGSLDEALAALVVEELNGSYELEMQYPIKGRHFDKLQLKNIIFCKPNMYTREQPFRIYSITKPIDGRVTVNAEHISYDASGVTILPKRNTETKVIESFGEKVTHNDEEGYFLDTILTDIKAMSVLPPTKNYFNLIRGSDKENVFKKDGYSIPAPTNLRSILGGDSGSILEKFKGEYIFDRFDVILKNKRGVDRGLTIRYGKNMLDIEHESEGNNLFTAIFPFYSKNYTETQQTTKPIFQETYIIEGVTPLRADWLSIELIDVSKKIGGINLKPVVEVMKVIVDGVEELVERYAPVRVKTPNDPENPSNDFYDKIYIFKRNKVDVENPELTNLFEVYVSRKHTETKIINEKEKTVEVIDEIKLSPDPEDVNVIVPEFGNIYVVKSDDSEHYNRSIIWDNGQFMEYSSDGFYVEAKDATLVDTLKDLKPLPTYPISWDEENSKWIEDHQNGWIYVEPKKPNIGTVSVDKYVYVDLLEYDLPEESNVLLENGVMYVNETLKNLSNQRILTLDLTSIIDDIDNLEPTDITSQHLFDEAEKYLKDNDLTKLKESITISFIKLSDSPEYEHLKALEIVELGDEINVIYEELGVNSKHRVIATHYNVLTDSYDEIELGEKTSKITNNIITSGDNISSLKNDAEYAEKNYVVDFVAENANIINAEIQKAIIETLEASNVNIRGLLVASHATIDDLVSQMLVTENAKISELLEAGSVRVRGKITALSGEIGGSKIEDGKLIVSTSISIENTVDGETTTFFRVDQNGNVQANSLTITGGIIDIGNGNFRVTNDGDVLANNVEITGGIIDIGDGNFRVTNEGIVTSKFLNSDGIATKNINADVVETEKVVTKRVYFGDDDVFIERITDTQQQPEEVVTQTVRIQNSSAIASLDGANSRILVSLYLDKPLWNSRTFEVSVSYRKQNYEPQYTIIVNIPVTISSDQQQGYGSTTVDGTINILSSSAFPSRFVETKTISEASEEDVDNLVVSIKGVRYNLGVPEEQEVDKKVYVWISETPPSNEEGYNTWFKPISEPEGLLNNVSTFSVQSEDDFGNEIEGVTDFKSGEEIQPDGPPSPGVEVQADEPPSPGEEMQTDYNTDPGVEIEPEAQPDPGQEITS